MYKLTASAQQQAKSISISPLLGPNGTVGVGLSYAW
jgi:hypothetical protein